MMFLRKFILTASVFALFSLVGGQHYSVMLNGGWKKISDIDTGENVCLQITSDLVYGWPFAFLKDEKNDSCSGIRLVHPVAFAIEIGLIIAIAGCLVAVAARKRKE